MKQTKVATKYPHVQYHCHSVPNVWSPCAVQGRTCKKIGPRVVALQDRKTRSLGWCPGSTPLLETGPEDETRQRNKAMSTRREQTLTQNRNKRPEARAAHTARTPGDTRQETGAPTSRRTK